MFDNFSLGDFLGGAASVYNSYEQGQSTQDQAKAAQAIAAAEAAKVQQQTVISARAKQLLIYGAIAVAGLLVVFIVVKKLK